MVKVEIHFHTSETSGCGKVPAAEGVKKYQENGYAGIMVTDHFSKSTLGGHEDGKSWEEVKNKMLAGYRAAKEAGDRLGIKIYLGMEIRFPENDNDYLLFGADEGFFDRHPWVYENSLAQFRPIAEEEGLCMIQAHPYRKGCEPAPAQYLDGAEIFNSHPGHLPHNHNDWAQKWIEEVREHGGPNGEPRRFIATVGSDFHEMWHFSGTGILLKTLPADEKELKERIASEAFDVYVPEEISGQ